MPRSKKQSAKKPGANRRARKNTSRVLDAVVLGVEKEYLILPSLTTLPNHPQPLLGKEGRIERPLLEKEGRGGEEIKKFHRPLVSPRTSFWLGVGFGVFVVGALAAIAWQLLRIGAVEAVVMGAVK